MLDPKEVFRASPGASDDRRQDKRRAAVARRRLTVGLALVVGLVLGACAIPFGNGTDSTEESPQKNPRDRNRLYLQEQERVERQFQFDRVGPSDR